MQKFVQTKGKLRYSSHKTEEQWSILILDTLNAIPLEQLIYEQPTTLEGLIEMDETYINDGFKGMKRTSVRKARKHGEGAQKRGLSEEKMCQSC